MRKSISLLLISFLFPSCIGMNKALDLGYLTAFSFIVLVVLMFGVIAAIEWLKRKMIEFNLKIKNRK